MWFVSVNRGSSAFVGSLLTAAVYRGHNNRLHILSGRINCSSGLYGRIRLYGLILDYSSIGRIRCYWALVRHPPPFITIHGVTNTEFAGLVEAEVLRRVIVTISAFFVCNPVILSFLAVLATLTRPHIVCSTVIGTGGAVMGFHQEHTIDLLWFRSVYNSYKKDYDKNSQNSHIGIPYTQLKGRA